MTTTEHHSPGQHTSGDPLLIAADARSILACPSSVSLVIEGEERAVDPDEELGLSEHGGTPTFRCREDSSLARAAAEHRSALLILTSGLGARGARERGDTLTLAGRLERTGAEHCECCDEVRHVVSLTLDSVALARPQERAASHLPEPQLRVPLEEFRSHLHQLNRGHLQRSVEHANDCHQDDLRRSVGTGTGTRADDLGGVRIARLTSSDVVVQWVDASGAHEQTVTFPRTARDLSELGEMLRRGLHAGLC